MRIPVLFAGWLLVSAVQAATLADQLDAAWRIDPEARALDARAGEFKARGLQIDSLLAAPPTVALGYRGDNLNGNVGQREYEAELDLPLWLPGQRSANQSALAAGQSALAAERGALRLKILGELREKNGSLRRARAEAELSAARLSEARVLEQDVERRYKAGDLARTDYLSARMETLAALREQAERTAAYEAARAALLALAGAGEAAPAETLSSASQAAHPELAARKAMFDAARQKIQAARQNRRDAPELTVFGRRERGSSAADYENSLGVRLRVPLSTEARNAPLLAEAQGEADTAEARWHQAQRTAEAAHRQAQSALSAAKQTLDFARQRAELGQEHYRHLRRAFDYGERDLPTLLRAKALADAARLEAVLAEVEMDIAVGRMNQALGVMP